MNITIDSDSIKQICLLLLSLGILACIALVIVLHVKNERETRELKREMRHDDINEFLK